MTSPEWDPGQYLRHCGDRFRPLAELLARVPALPGEPAPRIADLGCGPGTPGLALSDRWPGAHVTGYDNSPAMLERARRHEGSTSNGGHLEFVHADIGAWRPGEHFDLIFTNAALHWIPGHTALFPAWTEALPPGGVLALQVPGNFSAPSHTLLAELRNSPRWRHRLGTGPHREPVLDPAGYWSALAPLGCDTDAWETTYLHLLQGEDPVLEWMKGSTLRPVLALLADDAPARDAFLADYREALREAYPATPYGTPFPFRRIFAVAVKRR